MAVTTLAAAGAVTSAYGAYSSSRNQKKALGQQKTQNQVPQYIDDASRGAIDRAQQISRRGYTPFSGQRVAGLSANEQQAKDMASRFGEQTQARLGSGFQSNDLKQFENPYLDRVLANRKRGIGEEFDRQSSALAANQSATDAFRSGRSDLARSRLNKDRLRALDEAENTSRSDAYDRAMSSYFQDDQQRQGAFDRAQNALNNTGGLERNIDQAQKDFDYGQFLERRDWDINNLQPLLAAIGAARGGSTSTTTMRPGSKDYWGAAAGLLGTAISTLGNKTPEQPRTDGRAYEGGLTGAEIDDIYRPQ